MAYRILILFLYTHNTTAGINARAMNRSARCVRADERMSTICTRTPFFSTDKTNDEHMIALANNVYNRFSNIGFNSEL